MAHFTCSTTFSTEELAALGPGDKVAVNSTEPYHRHLYYITYKVMKVTKAQIILQGPHSDLRVRRSDGRVIGKDRVIEHLTLEVEAAIESRHQRDRVRRWAGQMEGVLARGSGGSDELVRALHRALAPLAEMIERETKTKL